MTASLPPLGRPHRFSRRTFLKVSAAGAGGLAAGQSLAGRAGAVGAGAKRPNFLVIICDQLNLDAIAAHGCPHVKTPNLDRLIARGTTFLESHSTNPVCSPARSSIFTGRMPVETGVTTNDLPINPGVPNMGEWLRRSGYQTVYCGKWHLPEGYPPLAMPGFEVMPVGKAQGDLCDPIVSRECEAFLNNRAGGEPFLLVASFLQPHDICYWSIHHDRLVPADLPFAELAGRLPPVPPNNQSRPKAPAKLDRLVFRGFSEAQWRYYLWCYYRMVEILDADVGRLLAALETSGHADNTIVLFTSDHGEGGGRHSHVQKWYPYEESVKVPLIVSCPGRVAEGLRDADHLVSGLDLMSTVCDYAGAAPPPNVRGFSLRPLLERRAAAWRDYLVTEHHQVGRMVRTARWKYVQYEGDPVEQLFDLKNDPWEMKNLYDDPQYADVVKDHRRRLKEWESQMIVAPAVAPKASGRPKKK